MLKYFYKVYRLIIIYFIESNYIFFYLTNYKFFKRYTQNYFTFYFLHVRTQKEIALDKSFHLQKCAQTKCDMRRFVKCAFAELCTVQKVAFAKKCALQICAFCARRFLRVLQICRFVFCACAESFA